MSTGQQKLSNDYSVYILRCNDDSLYVGISNNFEKRLKTHNRGHGAKYTRGRLPLICVYLEHGFTKGDALRREIELKKMNKRQKEALILKDGLVKHDI